MWKRILVLLVALWVAACIALFGVHHGDPPAKANAVFVLSGSPKRLPVGIRLVQERYAPLLVVSEAPRHPSPLEAEACGGKLGVHVVCFHAHPYSTVGEAEQLGRMAAKRGWTRVDVVTSEYHVVRARILMRRCYGGELRVVGAPNDRWRQLIAIPLESVKLLYHEVWHRSC
jgi:DUF218 domain